MLSATTSKQFWFGRMPAADPAGGAPAVTATTGLISRLLWPAILSVILLLGGGSSGALANSQLYRYLNADGRTEISHSVPTDRVKYGYDVLDAASGQVLQRVAPELTPSQARRKAEYEIAYAECTRLQNRVRTLYQSKGDIDYAEEKALEAIDNRIANIQANLVQLRIQRTQLEDRAAQLERSGQRLDANVVSNVERAASQIQNLEQQILDRRTEQDETRLQYETDRSTFNRPDCELATVR